MVAGKRHNVTLCANCLSCFTDKLRAPHQWHTSRVLFNTLITSQRSGDFTEDIVHLKCDYKFQTSLVDGSIDQDQTLVNRYTARCLQCPLNCTQERKCCLIVSTRITQHRIKLIVAKFFLYQNPNKTDLTYMTPKKVWYSSCSIH